jgi:DNA gyrase inhibitor GyrI
MKKILTVILALCLLCLISNWVIAKEEAKTKKTESCNKTEVKTEKAEPCNKTEVKSDEECSIELKEVEPFNYCALEMTGSYAQHPDAFQKLYEQAGMQKLETSQIPLGIYLNDPNTTPEEELKWEVGLSLLKEKEVKEPLVLKKWEFNKLVSTIYDGPFNEQLGAAYQKVFEWIGKNHLQPAGPSMEKFLSQVEKDEEGIMRGKVEILIPVMKIEKKCDSHSHESKSSSDSKTKCDSHSH